MFSWISWVWILLIILVLIQIFSPQKNLLLPSSSGPALSHHPQCYHLPVTHHYLNWTPIFSSHVYSLPSCYKILQCKLLVRYAVDFLSCSQLCAQGPKQYLEPSRCVINIGCMNEWKHVCCASASFLSHVTDRTLKHSTMTQGFKPAFDPG